MSLSFKCTLSLACLSLLGACVPAESALPAEPGTSVPVGGKADRICPQVVGTSPSCGAAQLVVPSCPSGGACEEVIGTGDRCNESLTCLSRPDFCPQVLGAPAMCPAGAERVVACGEERDCVAVLGTGDQCDDLALCQLPSQAPSLCPQVEGAPPTCDGGVPVPRCPAGSRCEEALGTGDQCDVSVLCLKTPTVCPQVVGRPAQCPPAWEDVTSCSGEACLVSVGEGDQCDDVVFCEPTAPLRQRTFKANWRFSQTGPPVFGRRHSAVVPVTFEDSSCVVRDIHVYVYMSAMNLEEMSPWITLNMEQEGGESEWVLHGVHPPVTEVRGGASLSGAPAARETMIGESLRPGALELRMYSDRPFLVPGVEVKVDCE